MAEKDYYRILGVSKNATHDDVKNAYLELAKKYHPDVNPGFEREANERLKEINEAYATLSDPEKRKRYDSTSIAQEPVDIQVRPAPSVRSTRAVRPTAPYVPRRAPGKRPVTPTEAEAKEQKTREQKKRRNTLLTALAIVVLIATAAGVGYYLAYAMPFQKTIIKVDNDTVNIGYFIKRVIMSSSSSSPDIWGTMQNIVYELIMKQEAPLYVGEVTEEDIDAILRDAATGTSESITDAEFREWYRQQLGASQLSDREFRDIVSRSILAERMSAYLSDRVPTVAEQVHLNFIMVLDYDTAVQVKERIDGGEDFAIVAQEVSLDASKDQGGDSTTLSAQKLGSKK